MKKLTTLIAVIFIVSSTQSLADTPWMKLRPSEIFTSKDAQELAESAANGDTQRIDYLLAKGVNINEQGANSLTPLFSAVYANNLRGAKRLLEHGANPNLSAADGSTVVHIASYLVEDATMLSILLSASGDPSVARTSDGNTPLHLVMRTTNKNQIRKKISLLLGSGASIDSINKEGETAVMEASKLNMFDITYELLELGADYAIRSNRGITLKKYSTAFPLLRKDADQVEWREKVISFITHKEAIAR